LENRFLHHFPFFRQVFLRPSAAIEWLMIIHLLVVYTPLDASLSHPATLPGDGERGGPAMGSRRGALHRQ
jgi:hypothetical protein